VAAVPVDEILLDDEIENWDAVKNYESRMGRSLELAESIEDDRYVLTSKAYWKTYWEDAKSLVTAPARFDTKDWLIAGTVIGAGVGMMMIDEEIQGWVQDNKNDASQAVSDGARVVGDPFLMISAVFATYYFAKKTDNLRLRRSSLLALEALAIAQVINVPLKALAGRDRPKKTDDAFAFSGPTFSLGPSSFVSGHTIAAFGIASIFALEYREKPWVAFVSYGLATAVGMQRVHDDHHWASDVFLGAAIGTAVGYLVYRNAEKRPDWVFIPEIQKDYYGMRVTHEFGGHNGQIRYAE
jgi:membrane-associated phospholipid phosphatase